MTRETEKLTREDETRAVKIAKIAARLPEREQDQLLYMVQGYVTFKGLEQIAEKSNETHAPRAAAVV